MSTLYLSARPEWSRERLIRRLKEKLTENGVRFHERSLRRQLGGAVESVPPELEETLEAVLIEDTPFVSHDVIQAALAERGLTTSRPDPDYVAAERAVLLTRLWLYQNPGISKRALAQRLSKDLAAKGVTVGLDALQSELAGRGQLVRREVLEILVSYLAEKGITSEEDALAKSNEWKEQVDAFEQGRDLVDGQRFRALARLWQVRHKQASSRRLAALLGEKLRERGVRVGLDHLQRLVSGKARRIRVEVLQAMDDMLGTELGPEELEQALNKSLPAKRALDLAWVQAQPIRELAQQWVESHPGTTMRQLALRVAQTVRRMGYSTSHNTIQPILGGWKQRTRGYVYRAMLMQFEDGRSLDVPMEHVIAPVVPIGEPIALATATPGSQATSVGSESAPKLRMHAGSSRRAANGLTLDAFLREAKKSLPKARSPLMARLLALRAVRLFGLDLEEAEALIKEKAMPRARTGRKAVGVDMESGDEVPVIGDDLAPEDAVGMDVTPSWDRPLTPRGDDEGRWRE